MPRVSIDQFRPPLIPGSLLNIHLLTSPANVGWREVGDPLELDVKMLMDGGGMPMDDFVG